VFLDVFDITLTPKFRVCDIKVIDVQNNYSDSVVCCYVSFKTNLTKSWICHWNEHTVPVSS